MALVELKFGFEFVCYFFSALHIFQGQELAMNMVSEVCQRKCDLTGQKIRDCLEIEYQVLSICEEAVTETKALNAQFSCFFFLFVLVCLSVPSPNRMPIFFSIKKVNDL